MILKTLDSKREPSQEEGLAELEDNESSVQRWLGRERALPSLVNAFKSMASSLMGRRQICLVRGLLPSRKNFLWEICQDERVSYGMDRGSRLPFLLTLQVHPSHWPIYFPCPSFRHRHGQHTVPPPPAPQTLSPSPPLPQQSRPCPAGHLLLSCLVLLAILPAITPVPPTTLLFSTFPEHQHPAEKRCAAFPTPVGV